MPWQYDDGGRLAAGYKGRCGDCVVRAIAIAAQLPYDTVYRRCADGMGGQRNSKGRTARRGVSVKRKWFKDYMTELGFTWTPTMAIGTGCKVHLIAGELPAGRLVVALSRHYAAIINGVIHDTSDPGRTTILNDEHGQRRMMHRCVYGYWSAQNAGNDTCRKSG